MRRLVGLAGVLLVSSCTYNSEMGATPLNAVGAGAGFAQQKIPTSVALIANEDLRSLTLSASNAGYGVNIGIGEAVVSSFARELSTVFQSVRVSESIKKSGDSELVAQLRYRWVETSHNMSGDITFRVSAELTISDRSTRFQVAKFADERRADYHAPASASALMTLTLLSSYALSPITIPLTTQAIGSRAEELIAETINASAQGIRLSIEDDIEIEQYVASLSRGHTSGGASPAPQLAPRSASSQLDEFLNNVFVIGTGSVYGSAFCVSSQLLLTNEHVVHGSALVQVRRRNGQIHRGRVVNAVRGKDLAVVKLEEGSCTPLPLARSQEIVVGREVWAIGTPQGLSWSVSKGIVSAVRDLESARLIQTDAAVNSGNSGGPLIDRETGKVIGINTMMLRGGSAQGLNFAVSAEDALAAFPSLTSSQL